jgi:hypothetical protein
MLVAKFATQKGTAEAINTNLASASRLWLGALPGSGAQRPPLDGALQQDTYIRVYIPVQQ